MQEEDNVKIVDLIEDHLQLLKDANNMTIKTDKERESRNKLMG